MLSRLSAWQKDPSVLDELHKVRVYNPNGFEWETMDPSKKGMLIVKMAGTGEEKIIPSFNFTPLEHYKVIRGNCVLLDEYGDPVKGSDGNQVKKYFYTSQFSKYAKPDQVIGFKSEGSNPIWLQKKDLLEMIKTPRINWAPNPFFELKKDKKMNKYNSTILNSDDVIYWVILDWELKGDYFQMYVKSSSMGNNFDYSAQKLIQAEEGTLNRVLDDATVEFNNVLKSQGLKPLKTIPMDQVDMKLKVTSKVGVNGEYNSAAFEFVDFSANRWDNTSDLEHIKELNKALFFEKFPERTPTSTVLIENNNCVLNIPFIKHQEEITTVDAEQVFDALPESAKESGADF